LHENIDKWLVDRKSVSINNNYYYQY